MTSIRYLTEKKLFVQYDYPKTEHHLMEHPEFVAGIKKLKKESSKGNILLPK
jgi:hemerythrin